MTVPPDDDDVVWYRRYWGRPYAGCGWLYLLLILLFFWFLCALVYPPLAVWETWGLFLHLVP